MIKEENNSFYDFRIDLLNLVDSISDEEFLDLLLSSNPKSKSLTICYNIDDNKLVILNKDDNFFKIKLSDTDYKSVKHLYEVSGYDCAKTLFDYYKNLLNDKLSEINAFLLSESSIFDFSIIKIQKSI